MQNNIPFVSIVMPCLNEEKTIEECIKKAKNGLKKAGFRGEVIVSDNGSTDNSVKLANKNRAKVVFEPKKGYGSACLAGIRAAKGDWIIMADSDGTYDFLEIPKFLNVLRAGYDLVIGSRFKGKIKKGSMPLLNRFLGTPVLNLFLKFFYNLKLSDSQSGMRAFTKKAFTKLKLKSLGMEFASEMLIRSSLENLKIMEIPINYFPRISPTKLSRFRDAWRHIRFMLLFAPTWLFLIPGTLIMGMGIIGVLALIKGPVWFFGRGFDIHSMIFASMLTLLGYQIIMLGIYAKVYSWTQGFGQGDLVITTALRYFKLEKGIVLGFLVALVGFFIGFVTFINWAKEGFGSLWAVRPAIFCMTLVVLGIQIIFSSFFLSILGIEKKN